MSVGRGIPWIMKNGQSVSAVLQHRCLILPTIHHMPSAFLVLPKILRMKNQKLVTLLANYILLQHPNVYVTPHCAFFTREAVQRILDITMANIEAFVRGEPQNVVVPLQKRYIHVAKPRKP